MNIVYKKLFITSLLFGAILGFFVLFSFVGSSKTYAYHKEFFEWGPFRDQDIEAKWTDATHISVKFKSSAPFHSLDWKGKADARPYIEGSYSLINDSSIIEAPLRAYGNYPANNCQAAAADSDHTANSMLIRIQVNPSTPGHGQLFYTIRATGTKGGSSYDDCIIVLNPINITIQDTERTSIIGEYTDETTIRLSHDNVHYRQNPGITTEYNRIEHDDNNNCDTVIIVDASDPSKAKAYDQKKKGRNDENLSPINPNCDIETIYEGRLANLDNRSLPPGSSGDGAGGASPKAEAEAEASCESENNKVYSWILCPVLDFVDETILGTGGGEGGADKKGLMGIVDDLLSVDASLYDNDGLKLAWSYFRNIAMAILVLVGLIMIVGTAISKE